MGRIIVSLVEYNGMLGTKRQQRKKANQELTEETVTSDIVPD